MNHFYLFQFYVSYCRPGIKSKMLLGVWKTFVLVTDANFGSVSILVNLFFFSKMFKCVSHCSKMRYYVTHSLISATAVSCKQLFV